jgi:hypothetical protein
LNNGKLLAAAAALAVALLHFTSIPATIWEFDESLFAMAVERYDPLSHNPPPPGYPIYIGVAKLVASFTNTPFEALVTTSAIAVLLGFFAYVFAFRAIAGNLLTGVVAALLLYASPAMLISGTLPQSDSGAMALFGLAIWACATRRPLLAALLCAATVGWRVQMSIAVAPMFLVTVVLLRTWRERIQSLALFGIACVAWLAPLVMATGGIEGYWHWLTRQAAYFAHHDSALSRSGYSPAMIGLRFIAHPWGPKFLAFPVLLAAAAGVILSGAKDLRAGHGEDPSPSSRLRMTLPLAIGCLAYLAFALWSMDPADAVRYALPSLPLVALLAALALTRVRPLAVLAIVYACGAWWYASPVLRTRAVVPSPPAASATWIMATVPRDAVVLYDNPLWPHSRYLLRGWRTMRIDAGLAKYGGDPSIPMALWADGERGAAEGFTFNWPDTDAYGKLTRRHYGAVSVIPLPVEQRFRVIAGVFPPERRRDGTSWRWIGARGAIELPHRIGSHVRVVLRTPPEYPLDANRIRVNGTAVDVRRGQSVELVIPYAQHIAFEPEKTFVPARIAGANNRDARTLSVMLTSVEQLAAPPAAQ